MNTWQKCKCPQCGNVIYSRARQRYTPQAGAPTICAMCATILVFSEEMGARLPTAEEQLEIDGNVLLSRTLETTRRAILMLQNATLN